MEKERGFWIACSLIIILSGLVLASYNYNEDITNFYNITVDNIGLTSDANITQVNITLPSSFSNINSVSSDAIGTPTISGNNLSWFNISGLIMNLSQKYFSFNATGAMPGNYNITITTTNATGSFSSNIGVTINDTTAPSITFNTPVNSANLSQNYIIINITATDEYSTVDTIILRFYNSTNYLLNTTSSTGSSRYINITNLSEGVYYYNVTVNDSKNNTNNSATRSLRLDTTAPVVTLISPMDEDTWDSSNIVSFKFNVSDVSIVNCSLIVDGTTKETDTSIDVGSTQTITHDLANKDHYHWKINCTDYAGHTGLSSIWKLIIDYTEDSASSSTTTTSFWTNSYSPTDQQLQDGFAKLLKAKERIRVKIGTESHYVGIIKLTSTNATINVSSTPQQAVFNVGETKSFEITNDSYYDIKVKLNSVNSTMANVTVWYILPTTSAPSTTNTTTGSGTGNVTTNATSTTESTITFSKIIQNKLSWIGLGVVVLVVVGIWYYLRRRKRTKGY